MLAMKFIGVREELERVSHSLTAIHCSQDPFSFSIELYVTNNNHLKENYYGPVFSLISG